MKSPFIGHGAIIVLGIAALASCTGNARVSPENARLRSENLELQEKIAALQRHNRELEVKLQSAAADPDTLPPEIRAAIPQIMEITISRLSFARDSDQDGRPDAMTVYVMPLDGLGRFEQAVGSITAAAYLLPEADDPLLIGRNELGPTQVRDAYRYNFTGLHYAIDLPIEVPDSGSSESGAEDALVRVHYTDGRNGKLFTAERTVRLKR